MKDNYHHCECRYGTMLIHLGCTLYRGDTQFEVVDVKHLDSHVLIIGKSEHGRIEVNSKDSHTAPYEM